VAFTPHPEHRGTDLAAALTYVTRVQRRRAVLFVISDWIAPPSTFVRALEVAARRHDTIAIQLVDPRERTLPDVGLVTLRDPETGRWRTVDTGRAAVRDQYAATGVRFDTAVRRALERRGIDLIRLETGRGYVAPLVAFFRRRERRQRH
jgi:hypothetical protein